ncbi:MAG: copper-binding protein [Chitinophagaceae bacterium]|nr:copper-binding protein [Rubrivivax sp.]
MSNTFITTLAAAAALLLTLPALAQSSSGEVVKIDKPGGRITLKHDSIKALDMPAMTLAFRVREARMLDNVAVGDRVRFDAEKLDGSYTVTALAKQP